MSHAAERAWEHYGLRLSRRDMALIHSAIFHRDRTTIDLGARRDGSRFVAVRHRHTWLAACTDGGNFVMTFLPRHTLDEHRTAIWERRQELRQHELQTKGHAVP